jgi:hypothetical protein
MDGQGALLYRVGFWGTEVLAAVVIACGVLCPQSLLAHTLAAGTAPMQVLRVTASIGFLAYAAGSISDGIWFGKPWVAVGKDLLDALIYGFAGGAAFAWLWPQGG